VNPETELIQWLYFSLFMDCMVVLEFQIVCV